MPPDVIRVSRPSRWGNWHVVKRSYTGPWIVEAVNKHGHPTGSHWGAFDAKIEASAFAVVLYERALEAMYVERDGPLNREWYLKGLAGHDLACWCPILDEHGGPYPCHATILLKLANALP